MDKERIQNLVARNKLAAAIDLIGGDESTMLHSRLNAINREVRLGIVSRDKASMEYNRIVYSILECAGIDENPVVSSSIPVQSESPEFTLNKIIIENKRRRPEIAIKASDILNEIRAYNDNKVQQPSFDPTGRRYRVLMDKVKDLRDSVSEAKGNSLEAIVDKINSLISDNIPSYDKLQEAYKLAVGRGMVDNHVKTILENQPDDDEARITVATAIELFIANISAK